jgi:hypothetical protein
MCVNAETAGPKRRRHLMRAAVERQGRKLPTKSQSSRCDPVDVYLRWNDMGVAPDSQGQASIPGGVRPAGVTLWPLPPWRRPGKDDSLDIGIVPQ